MIKLEIAHFVQFKPQKLSFSQINLFLEIFKQNGNHIFKNQKKNFSNKNGKAFGFFLFRTSYVFSITFLQKLFCNVKSLSDVIL